MNICVYCLVICLVHTCFAETFSIVDGIAENGYPVEYHEIGTEDGYILGTYRIPYGRRSRTKQTNKYPVLLMHGLLSISEAFLLLGPDKSLGYLLADNGYDVWLCNARGTRHSRKHKSLNPDTDKQFWNFSWHEIGVYDIPALIDYALNVTNRKKLHFVGHSQGTTAFFVMGSERPEYNQKLRVAIMLAPSAFNIRAPSELLQAAIPLIPVIQKIADALKIYEILPIAILNVLQQIVLILCAPNSAIYTSCQQIFNLAFGDNEDQIDPAVLSLVSATHPGGCSINQIIHYTQLITAGRFQKYDWGPIENVRKYGAKTPPQYNLKNITAPVAMFYAEKDAFAQTVGRRSLPLPVPETGSDEEI